MLSLPFGRPPLAEKHFKPFAVFSDDDKEEEENEQIPADVDSNSEGDINIFKRIEKLSPVSSNSSASENEVCIN